MAAPALQVFLLALVILFIHCDAFPLPAMESASPMAGQGRWVETFTAAPESVKLGAGMSFQDTTIRQTIPVSIGGDTIRLTLSNAYGLSDLPIDKITVALPQAEDGHLLGSGSINTQSLRTVTFSGKDSVNVPRGGPAVSDPIAFKLTAGQVISVSMYLRSGQASVATTSHLYSQTTSAIARGDQSAASRVPTTGRNGLSWYFISSVEAWSANHKALVIIGDSITDGRGSPVNANLKWPSILSHRAQANGLSDISVVNQGSGGNQVVAAAEGPSLFQPSAVSRVGKILDHDGLGYVMLFEGINDIGNAPPDAAGQKEIENKLIQGYKQIISEVHARGLSLIGATITPFMCPPNTPTPNRYSLDPIREQTRLNVNQWIRSSGSFDSVVDFDQVLRDPRNPAQMAPQFIGPDCLHPSAAGYQALAEGFPLEILGTLGSSTGVQSRV